MKINRLEIANFRNHKKTKINLDRINFFVGGNNSGKTTILAAIEWALTGRCMWTDKAGRGAADLVRQGEKQAVVALDMEGLGAVIRSLPPNSLQVGQVSGVNEGLAAICNFLGASEDRLRVALNTGAFMAMSQAGQRTFLFNAYGLSWTVERVAADLTDWLTKKGHQKDDAGRLAKKAKSYYPAGITGGPEIFEAMEKRAKEERKELKKDKQRAEAALAEMEDTSPRQNEDPNQAEQIKIRLRELKERRDEFLRACGASESLRAKREALLIKISDVEEGVRTARDLARSLAEELSQCGEPAVESGGIERELQEKINTLTKNEASAKSKLEAINKAGAALSSRDRMCPLAPNHLQCCLTSEQLDAVLITLRKEHKLISQELKSLSQELAQAREGLAEETRKREESQARSKRALILKGKLNTQQTLLDSLQASLTALTSEMDNLPEANDSTETEEELQQVTTLIAELETTLKQHTESQAFANKKTCLEKDVETLSAAVADAEILVRALGPDGLRRDLLAGVLAGFVRRVNDRLGRLTEGAYQVFLGSDMTILCRANGEPVLPLRLLSTSEKLRVGIAISDALSAAAGLKFLAIDEADMLDQVNRDLLAGMLLDLADEYDQVLVFTTVGDVKPENPGIPGVKMFQLNEGAVQEI